MNIKPTDIKWILDNFEVKGFSCGNGVVVCPSGLQASYLAFIEESTMAYPLFLQRVIESMGDNSDYIVIQSNDFINVTHKDSEFITDEVFGEDDSLIDECKEQAIMYIVEHMRGNDDQ